MIKSYSEITGKYLRANKKRTVLTLIGIILSVSLISSIGFFLKSMQEAQIQDMKMAYGSWHVMYKNADIELITKIRSNPAVLRSGTFLSGDIKDISDRLKAREVYGSDEGLEILPYKLKEGRFPKADGEVAVEQWFLDKVRIGGRIGDSIEVLGNQYTLVGILKDTYNSQANGLGDLLVKDSGVDKGGRYLFVELRPNGNLRGNIDELRKLSDAKSIEENKNLIIAQGQDMPKGMIGVVAVIIAIVIISTIAVIYNAFQISVVERVKQFGLLRAVGSTPKQIRRIILREATFLAAIGVPIGLGFGIAAIYGIDLAFKIIGGEKLMLISPKITDDVIVISILIGLFSIYTSALLPAIFAGRVSPLVAISSRNSITKENLKRRKSLIMGRIFGFEGAMASKNIKRNRKRYRITVFSIVISVTLFISFKSFMDMSLNVYSEINESSKMHFSILADSIGKETDRLDESIIDKINKLPQVETSYRAYNLRYFDAAVDKRGEVKEIRNIGTVYQDINYQGENRILLNGSLTVYDHKSLEAAKGYLKEGSIDIERLKREDGVIIIGKNRVYNQNTDRSFYGPIIDMKAGDEILLQKVEAKSDGKGKIEFGQGSVNKVKVLAVLESNPFTFRGGEGGLKIITSKETAERLASESINPSGLNLRLKDINLENEAKKEIENIISGSNNAKLINIIDQNRNTKGVILMVKILLYGFVIVVSLIGGVNIINTLTTNIILRRREFASLKSIGLTQRGLRKMITLEGMLYGAMGSIYGAVFGSLLAWLLYKGVNDVREQSFIFPWDSIAIAAVGAMLIGYVSVLAPLRRMKRDNLIEAVREDF